MRLLICGASVFVNRFAKCTGFGSNTNQAFHAALISPTVN